MKLSEVTDFFWGSKGRLSFLILASCLLLFTFLGARDIWTQEHRWAEIVFGMFYRQDFLHPYLGNANYYDKPLLSYWLIAFFAKLLGSLTGFSLRLPSALAGLLAIWSIYRLGTAVKDRQLGLLAGWLLLTAFYFVFWARTSSADMLNLAGSLFAVSWYMEHRKSTSFINYFIFFLILALTSLCKGLVGFIVPFIAVITDIFLQKTWKRHFNLSLILAFFLALVIYLLPFMASSFFGGNDYRENGLYLVYRENILRYFKPFDHQGSIYTYLIYLPIYLLPSTLLFIPALYSLPNRLKTMSLSSKWISFTLLFLFLFFSLSGSRRSYYVLPIIPFAILFIADWLNADKNNLNRYGRFILAMIIVTYLSLYAVLDLFPAWYYAKYGAEHFSLVLKQKATEVKPWKEWNIVLLDAESKLNFYLQLSPDVLNYPINGEKRFKITPDELKKSWPILENKPEGTIFISRKMYANFLKSYLSNYRIVEVSSRMNWFENKDEDTPIAFIPLK